MSEPLYWSPGAQKAFTLVTPPLLNCVLIQSVIIRPLPLHPLSAFSTDLVSTPSLFHVKSILDYFLYFHTTTWTIHVCLSTHFTFESNSFSDVALCEIFTPPNHLVHTQLILSFKLPLLTLMFHM